jgi:glycosyltransferase involved in cell wall biosynthesis
MQGTFGRIIQNLTTSPTFQGQVQFLPHRLSVPEDGGLARRWVQDLSGLGRRLAGRPDVFHLIMNRGRAILREYPAVQLARALGVGTVLDLRAGALRATLQQQHGTLAGSAREQLFRAADEIVVECRSDVALIKEQFGRDAVYLPNTMPEATFRRVVPAVLPPAPGEPLRLIYSGRYIREKGIPVVLQALDLLEQRGRAVEFHLTGAGTDRSLLDLIARRVANPGAKVRVVDHGWAVPDLLGLLRSAHVSVMLSSWPGEGHPNSLTESMTLGLASILADWAHRSTVIPAEGHLLVPADSPEAFAAAVEHYLDDPALLQRAGEANRRFVEQNFLDTQCHPRLLEAWRRAGARGRTR